MFGVMLHGAKWLWPFFIILALLVLFMLMAVCMNVSRVFLD